MNHPLTVDAITFAALKGRKRYLIASIKTTETEDVPPIVTVVPDYQTGDTTTITQDGTRNQVSFEINSIEPLHSRSVILGLFAPYAKEQNGVEVIPVYAQDDIKDVL
jgi:hypothetical protein